MFFQFTSDALWVASVSSLDGRLSSSVALWHVLDGSIVKTTGWDTDGWIAPDDVNFTPGKGHLAIHCNDRLILRNTRHPFDVIAERQLARGLLQWWRATWSPDRALFATRCAHSEDGSWYPRRITFSVALYKTDTLEVVFSHELEGPARPDGRWQWEYSDGFAFSHDCRHLLCTQTAADESICWIWGIPYSTASPRMLVIGCGIKHARFNPVDSSQVFVVTSKGAFEVRDVTSGAILAQSQPTPGFVSSRRFLYSSDGRHIAPMTGNYLYDIETDLLVESLKIISFSPDGTRLLSLLEEGPAEERGNVLLKLCQRKTPIGHWEVITVLVHCGRDRLNQTAVSTSFSPDSRLLATGYRDGTVLLWNAEDGTCLAIFTEHTASVASQGLAFSPDGRILGSAADDGAVHFHRL